MRSLFAIISALFVTNAHSADIAIALTDERVDVDTVFSGAELTLFGVVTGFERPQDEVEIIAVVEGPPSAFSVREIEKRGPIWAPGRSKTVENAPGLYLTSATNTIDAIAPEEDQSRLALGPDHLDLHIKDATADDSGRLFAAAFLTEAEERGLYANAAGDIRFRKGGLFTVRISLPATTPVGEYKVRVFLYSGGEQLGADGVTLSVDKVGMERQIYEFAHSKPISYGIVCVVIALAAGWAAAFAFRK